MVEAREAEAGARGLADAGERGRPRRVALLGNPNTGKTTLFNRLTGLRHKTSNFPGTTLEARTGRVQGLGGSGGEWSAEVMDLPGVYSLELEQLESRVAREALAGRGPGGVGGEPDALCVVVDATNLGRNLRLAGEALRRRLPTVVAVNMWDVARARGLSLDARALGEALGCEVVLCCARSGEGLGEVLAALARARVSSRTPPGDEDGLMRWAEEAYLAGASGGTGVAGGGSVGAASHAGETATDRIDRVVTHPVLGLGVFVGVMAALFWVIFSLARWPMDVISAGVEMVAEAARGVMPAGLVSELLCDGVLGGVGTVLVFLPQICLLFFCISLLEDSGYLARGAFLMDRLLKPFGLPGHAFVPLLSSHACALPGIMACRGVPDPKERLATILVAPFMSCSARLPVYALLTGLLFPESAGLAALALLGCYGLGLGAGVVSALVARRTILRGRSRPMALELPAYRRPSVRNAGIATWDRALVFVRGAGTNILAICVVLWWLGAFPRSGGSPEAVALRAQEAALVASGDAAGAAGAGEEAAALEREAARLQRRESFLGWMGHAVEPVVRPLGYDWQLGVGVVASFAAREVFVGTMAVVTTGEADAEADGVLDRIAAAKRDDGVTPIFTPAASWSLLVYYVLAMQCLPTLAVTAREAGGWKWAGLQFAWMSGLAYVAAWVTHWLAA